MIHNTDANEITFNFIINIVGAILVYLVLKFKSDTKPEMISRLIDSYIQRIEDTSTAAK